MRAKHRSSLKAKPHYLLCQRMAFSVDALSLAIQNALPLSLYLSQFVSCTRASDMAASRFISSDTFATPAYRPNGALGIGGATTARAGVYVAQPPGGGSD